MKSFLGTLSENKIWKKNCISHTYEFLFYIYKKLSLQQVVVEMGRRQVIHNIQRSYKELLHHKLLCSLFL